MHVIVTQNIPAHKACSHTRKKLPCSTKFLRVLTLAASTVSSAIRKKSSRPKKLPQKNFPAKIYYTVDILIVDIVYRIESDSEDGDCLEDENTIDNPVDNASCGNVIILDHYRSNISHPRSRCYCTRMTMITAICFT